MIRFFSMSTLLQTGVALCLTVVMPIAVAQETKTPDKETADKQDAADQKDADKEDESDEPLFTVPEGTAEELFDFIRKVQRTPSKAKTRAEAIEHLKLQVAAIVKACQKIRESGSSEELEVNAIKEQMTALSKLQPYDPRSVERQLEALLADLETDERPAVKKIVRVKKLEQKAAKVPSMSDSERDSFIDELFAVIDADGLDRTSYGLVSKIGRSLGYSDSPEVGAKLYERLAAAMEISDDEALVSRAEKARGSARRLRLPGKFMELNGRTAEGETFDWASYRGKVVLVDFWASWCGPCRAEIPNMKAQLEKYGDKGFAIVGINLDRTHEAYQKYVDAQELTWTNLMSDQEGEMGWDNPIATQYGITGIPTAILVDTEGKVVSMRARGQALNKQLDELLGPAEEPEAAAEGDEAGDS